MSKEYDLIADLEEAAKKNNSVLETVNGIDFYKHDKNDKIWWVQSQVMDDHRFSFDQKKIFDFFKDYPKKLTKKQKKIFDKECPELADFQ